MRRFHQPQLGLFATLIALLLLNGCATYRAELQSGLATLEQGEIKQSRAIFQKELKSGNDQLLRHLELGLLDHLSGQYQKSNQQLNQAELVAEELYTKKFSDMLAVALSNPRNGPYRGYRFEQVFIHYYKALNYLAMAFADPDQYQKFLDESQVEARKVDVMLNAISYETGGYQEEGDSKKSFFGKVVNSFNQLTQGKIDADKIQYREDGYIRYINGLIYELAGEIDDARISYQKAAEIYENGYAKQHNLGASMTEQVWFDVIRMMRKRGGFGGEWPQLAKAKLSEAMQKKLDQFDDKHGQLIILHHQGMIASRGELNLNVYINPYRHELVIRPHESGSPSMRQAQFAWFQYVYADHGLFDMLRNYYSGGPFGTIEGVFTKKIILEPVWSSVKTLGIDDLLKNSMRVTVPYYHPPMKPLPATIDVDNMDQIPMVLSQSLSSLAVQEQLKVARSELYEAIGRELLKRRLAYGVSEKIDKNADKLLKLFTDIAISTTSAAETRNWLSLPASIQVQRVALTPGTHSVTISEGDMQMGQRTISEAQIEIKAGQNQLISSRSFRRGATLHYYALEQSQAITGKNRRGSL